MPDCRLAVVPTQIQETKATQDIAASSNEHHITQIPLGPVSP